MNIHRTAVVSFVLIASNAVLNGAIADMGRSPVGPGGTYASILGGYTMLDGLETNGHYLTDTNGSAITVEVKDGYFVGGSVGHVFDWETFSLVNNRIEASFAATNFFADDRSDVDGSIGYHQGNLQSGLGGPIETKQDRQVYDVSLALKGDLGGAADIGAAIGLEFFTRYSDDEQKVRRITGPVDTRDVDVDTWYYGTMFVVQPEIPINGGVSLVFDLGAGVYGYDADGDFDGTDFGGMLPRVSDNKTGIAFRGRAIGGLKFAFEYFSATLFGGIDYWSDVPVAQLSADTFIGPPTSLANESVLETKAGIEITVPFGG